MILTMPMLCPMDPSVASRGHGVPDSGRQRKAQPISAPLARTVPGYWLPPEEKLSALEKSPVLGADILSPIEMLLGVLHSPWP